jgi:hypothetical protein
MSFINKIINTEAKIITEPVETIMDFGNYELNEIYSKLDKNTKQKIMALPSKDKQISVLKDM